MALTEIPLDPSVPAFSYYVDLEGTLYQFDFRWNGRTEQWVFDLYDDEQNAVQLGNPLIIEFPLMFQNQRSNKPPGLLIGASEQSRTEATRFNLGTDVKLLYEESDND